MAKSWRKCATKDCEAESIYGAFCTLCQREYDPQHLGFIDWGDDLDEQT